MITTEEAKKWVHYAFANYDDDTNIAEIKQAEQMAIKSLEAYEEIMSHAEDEHSELIEVLQEIRKAVWDVDIPSPTVPEYIEHHKQIQGILVLIDSKIKEVSE